MVKKEKLQKNYKGRNKSRSKQGNNQTLITAAKLPVIKTTFKRFISASFCS